MTDTIIVNKRATDPETDSINAMYDAEFQKFWGRVVAQAWDDPDLTRKLLNMPDATIRQLAKEQQGWDLNIMTPNLIFAVNKYHAGQVDDERVVAILPLPPKPASPGSEAGEDISVLGSCCCCSSTCCCC